MKTTTTEKERQELILLENKNHNYLSVYKSLDKSDAIVGLILINKIENNNHRINQLNSK